MNRRQLLASLAISLFNFPTLTFQKDSKFTCTVLQFDKLNKNNRIYPSSLIPNILKDYNTLGTLGMPDSCIIKLAEVSHCIKNLYVVDKDLIAEIEVLDTPNGNILRKMLENPESVAFRTAGMGSLEDKDGITVIGDDYKLVSINAVNAEEAS